MDSFNSFFKPLAIVFFFDSVNIYFPVRSSISKILLPTTSSGYHLLKCSHSLINYILCQLHQTHHSLPQSNHNKIHGYIPPAIHLDYNRILSLTRLACFFSFLKILFLFFITSFPFFLC